jgi:hypothetical protein
MNYGLKITLEPLTFKAFNALDVLVNGEISEIAYRVRRDGNPVDVVHLESLREVRRLIDRARPPEYAAAIRASYARPDVCET